MELLYYARLMRRHWLLLLLSLLTGVGAAVLVTVDTAPRYVAGITMLVSADDREGSLSTALQAGALSQQRVQSYATLLTSRRVVGQIAQGEDVDALQEDITATAIPSTSLLRVAVADSDPKRAAQRADALGAAFTRLIDEIERPSSKSPPTVRVAVIDKAEVPEEPVSPRLLVNVALGGLTALFAAVGWVVLRDRLDTTVKTADALQQVSRTSLLGVIGYEREARRKPLITGGGSRSARAESFRSLRTNLQFIGVDRQPKSLVVTSCLPDEGKSSTSVNLAITMAEAGWRVILVDGDLRRPSVPGYLGIEGGTGLTDVLIDKANLAEVVQTWGRPGLSVLPSGRIPPNPSELLGSQGMRAMLAQLTAEYDMVIIDAPPLLPVTDAAALGAICDGALLVVRHGRTRREQVVRAVELLSSISARLVGTVLNFVPAKHGSYYGHGYGYDPAEQETAPETPRPQAPMPV
ncbi:polysaccharide biosynthesis tyrosine autokinase [Microbispora bryophytorum]|uniref:non-specific protein-tyrosine kinase n=1 Tax=Microbispora bryophytorum TaxID=1460882 RepID=A0A8H9LFZ4_9ACTN|nr:polysaccharide biosynthesis tyrosine autokinase [Microbispora bryophytorum]MBD3139462.1 polysaccharide biosynthesis tyrosine autokinase [Microbispora bryophytorum]TQS04476.1 polysaccharide biosynthesis tyrosine autokinase [Microbispora bryophytorum]GGO23627.1 chromosome partitioning protein [Microbispora bryophytorum]